MRIAQIRELDVSNGSGCGVSLWVQGCSLRCLGCHNDSIWDFDGGVEYNEKVKDTICKLVNHPYITRFSILGGEPTENDNIKYLLDIILAVKEIRPDITIWMWSGYTIEQLNERFKTSQRADTWEQLKLNLDYLIDGPYDGQLRDITLKYKGSTNQRVWNCKNWTVLE